MAQEYGNGVEVACQLDSHEFYIKRNIFRSDYCSSPRLESVTECWTDSWAVDAIMNVTESVMESFTESFTESSFERESVIENTTESLTDSVTETESVVQETSAHYDDTKMDEIPYGRRNPWGPFSYAQLITQAISSTPEKRMTLNQIYDYLTSHFSYFQQRKANDKSASWKVKSINTMTW